MPTSSSCENCATVRQDFGDLGLAGMLSPAASFTDTLQGLASSAVVAFRAFVFLIRGVLRSPLNTGERAGFATNVGEAEGPQRMS